MKFKVFEKISHEEKLLRTEIEMPKFLEKKLKQEGYKLIDGGTYSRVYSKPKSNSVLKIGLHDIEEDGYIDFVRYVHKNKNNPYLPKVGKLQIHNTKNGKYYIIRIEKLEQQDYTKKYKPLLKYFKNNPDDIKIIKKLKEFFPNDFVNTLVDLSKNFPKIGLDLTNDNIMQRKDGTLVITDPVY